MFSQSLTQPASGHQFAFCASGNLFSALKQRGFKVYSTPPATLFGLPVPLSRVLTRRMQHVTPPVKPGRDFGNIWFVLFLSGMANARYLKRLVDAERSAAQDFTADGIFTDLDPGAYLLAKIDGLPIATAYQTPMNRGVASSSWRLMNRAVITVLASNQVTDQTIDSLFFGQQVLKTIPSIPELEDTPPAR